jgi:hypothetical protein
MQILTALVIEPARIVPTKYGDRCVTKLRLPGTAEPLDLWCNVAQAHYVMDIPTGAALTVGKHATGKLSVIEQLNSAPPAPPATKTIGFDTAALPAAPAAPDTGDRVVAAAELYAQAFLAIQKRLGNQLEPESLVSAASCLFIQLNRG